MDVVFLCYAVNTQAETLKHVKNRVTQQRITLLTTTESTTTANIVQLQLQHYMLQHLYVLLIVCLDVCQHNNS